MRTLVIWCPDWPAVAAARHAKISSAGPVAVFKANRVQACTQAARAEGIVIGMRRREAQARCPELTVLADDKDITGRMFEPVVSAVEAIVPGIEVLRPGMIACSANGPRRYFGSETQAAEQIVDVVEALDVEARIGIADNLPVAVLAARQNKLVARNKSADFCAELPIMELAREPAISPPERKDLVDLLIRLGITTAGAFAALPQERVATRFGADAVIAHQLAQGKAQRDLSRRHIPQELTIVQQCDPPLDRVDTAAFLGRALAQRFHTMLAEAGLACTRVAITAKTDSGQVLHRIWRAARPLSPEATADRLRWQLDGWLTQGRLHHPGDENGPGAITELTIEPIEAVDAGRVQYGLWGADGREDHRATWALARIQGLLGPESVQAPVLSGGRTPHDRVEWVSWGDERVAQRDPAAPWPGRLPAPSPTMLTESGAVQRVQLCDRQGKSVVMSPRGGLTGIPRLLDGRAVTGWAGPWIFDERWWAAGGRPENLVSAKPRYSARLQVQLDDTAWLIRYVPGPPAEGCWQLEGSYD